jgi:hypothetical protein
MIEVVEIMDMNPATGVPLGTGIAVAAVALVVLIALTILDKKKKK